VLGKVCCDSPNCGVEWFHFACVGLSASPEGEWLCPVCELLPENVRKTEPTLESPVDANANDGHHATNVHCGVRDVSAHRGRASSVCFSSDARHSPSMRGGISRGAGRRGRGARGSNGRSSVGCGRAHPYTTRARGDGLGGEDGRGRAGGHGGRSVGKTRRVGVDNAAASQFPAELVAKIEAARYRRSKRSKPVEECPACQGKHKAHICGRGAPK